MKKQQLLIPAPVIFAFVFGILSAPIFAQSMTGDKTGLVSVKTPNDNFNRQRVVKSNPAKSTFKFSEAQLSAFEKEAFQLINAKRREIGLPEIKWSDEVAKIARLHSENMADFNFFDHSGTDGKMVDERADQLGIKKWRAIGENIAFNYGFEKPIEIAVEKWMLSTSHRENLLNRRWTESGIGIAVTEDGKFYFTQVFLERR